MKKINFIFILLSATICLYSCGGNDDSNNISSNTSERIVKIGDTLHTDMFDIKVNSASIESEINTGNEFVDLKPEEGNAYFKMNVTFKNVDKESRMMFDGELIINQNGTEYKYDKSEPIMLEGWSILLDQINPMVSKTTNLVYKIPDNLTGTVSWHPGRASDNEIISLGSIDPPKPENKNN